MPEAAWRRRFRAATITLPSWARETPDRLVYASNQPGKWEVFTWERSTDRHRQLTDRPTGTPFWFAQLEPDGYRVWWFDDDRGNEFGRWMAETFEPGELEVAIPQLPPAYTAGLSLGRGCAVVGTTGEGGVEIRVVRDGRGRQIYRHAEQAYVGGLSRDETLVCIAHSEHGDLIHPALRVLDLEGHAVADLWDGPGLGLDFEGWSRVPGDQRILVGHERADLARPLLWDVRTGRATELAFELPGEISASWYPDGTALLVEHDHRGRSELYRYEIATGTLTLLPTPRGLVSAARVRPDGEVWYSWTSAATQPQVRADDRVLLHAPGERAPDGVEYSDANVDEVHVFVAEPRSPRPHPTVFDVHGGPTGQDSDEFSPAVQAWVDHGFAVVMVNYRGSTGYGRRWRDALIGNPGFTELEDLARVRDWVVRRGIADPGRIVLSGGSWGGYLTLLGLGLQPERWALGIAAVPVADYAAAYEDEMEPLKAFDRSLFGGSPDELPERYRERSPIAYVDRVHAPLLVLAGENDPRCPIRQIENYLARLRELDRPHEVYRYDAGHGSLVVEERIRQMETQIAFAAKHLRTTPPL